MNIFSHLENCVTDNLWLWNTEDSAITNGKYDMNIFSHLENFVTDTFCGPGMSKECFSLDQISFS